MSRIEAGEPATRSDRRDWREVRDRLTKRGVDSGIDYSEARCRAQAAVDRRSDPRRTTEDGRHRG